MSKGQISIIILMFTSGIIIGSMLNIVGFNIGGSNIEKELDIANNKIIDLENDISQLRNKNEENILDLNYRISDLTKIITERRGIWINEIPNKAVIFYDSQIVTIADVIECSRSMRPTFDCYDQLIVYKPEIQDIKKGDIIMFKEKTSPLCNSYTERTIIHRIIDVHEVENKIVFETKGDNNPVSDHCRIAKEDILFKIIAVIYNINK